MKQKQFPYVPADLVAALEEAFPDRITRASTVCLHAANQRIGEQRVLDLLRTHLSRQQSHERNL
jgi:hypothetical protein